MVKEILTPKMEEVQEIKLEIPSYEEFMKTYKSDEATENSYFDEIFAKSQIKAYGPVEKWCGKCNVNRNVDSDAAFCTKCGVRFVSSSSQLIAHDLINRVEQSGGKARMSYADEKGTTDHIDGSKTKYERQTWTYEVIKK